MIESVCVEDVAVEFAWDSPRSFVVALAKSHETTTKIRGRGYQVSWADAQVFARWCANPSDACVSFDSIYLKMKHRQA